MEAAGGGRGEPAVEAVVEAGEARAPLASSDDKLSDTNHASQVEKKVLWFILENFPGQCSRYL